MEEEDICMFPDEVLMDFCPGKTTQQFSNLLELYVTELVAQLLRYRAQSVLIRKSIVAVDSSTAVSLVTTREVCRTLRNFSGLPIPDLSSLTRVPTMTVDTAAWPAAPPLPTPLEQPQPPKKRGRPSTKS